MDKRDQRIAELEAELKSARKRYDDLRAEHDETLREHDQRIEKLKATHEKQDDTVSALVEQIKECDAQIERWIEAFDMVLDDQGVYTWEQGLIQDREKWFKLFQDLRTRWNGAVDDFNRRVAPRNMGRPLAASTAQRDRILAHHKSGRSLRWIAEEMNLGLQTVRTVIDKKDRLDRATVKRFERIAPDKIAEAKVKRSIRDIAALPKRINANLKRNAELIKQAKGLK